MIMYLVDLDAEHLDAHIDDGRALILLLCSRMQCSIRKANGFLCCETLVASDETSSWLGNLASHLKFLSIGVVLSGDRLLAGSSGDWAGFGGLLFRLRELQAGGPSFAFAVGRAVGHRG